MTSTMGRRLATLEVQRRTTVSYVVRLSDAALDDPAATHAAIMEHRRRTGWVGAVVLGPLELTAAEWLVKYGQAAT